MSHRVSIIKDGQLNPEALRGMDFSQLTLSEKGQIKLALEKRDTGERLSKNDIDAIRRLARAVTPAKAATSNSLDDGIKRMERALDMARALK